MRSSHKTAWTCATVVTFILFFYTFSFAQTENIKGVQFNDGSIIDGRVIEMNVNDIRIETKDGNIISRKFSDVANFIKDTGVDAKQEVEQAPVAEKVSQDKQPAHSAMGVYVGILGGYVIPSDMKSTVTANLLGGSTNNDIALDKGYLFGAKVGYLTPFTNKILAVELEYNHIINDFDKSKIYPLFGVNFNYNGKVQIDMLMLNILGRYPDGKFHPYIGVGGGYANVQISDIGASLAGIKLLNMSSGSKGVFAYQLLLGIDVDVTQNIVVGLGYKYISAQKVSYDATITSPLGPGSIPSSIDAEYNSHNLVLSVSYLF
jgi:opacity protein-like surface antigen